MLYQNNLTCKFCPYIKDEYVIRENYLDNNNDELFSEISKSCYCDKVGGKLGWWGYCEDAKPYKKPHYHIESISSNKEKHRKRRKNNEKYKKKLEWQFKTIKSYPSPCYAVDKYGNYTNEEDKIAYYKKTNKSKHASRFKYFKKLSNKKLRRHFDVIYTLEWDCFHYDWMDEDPEYLALYCDEYGYEWDLIEIMDVSPKYALGLQKGIDRKIFDYWWNVC